MRTLLRLVLCLAIAGHGHFVQAHGDEDHGKEKDAKPAPFTAPLGEPSPARLADGSVFVPKTSQRQLAIRTILAKIEDHAQSVELNGRVIADPNAAGQVQASQAGRIEPGPRGLPLLGQAVARGEVLAYLRPVASAIQRGNQQAQLAELGAQLEITQAKVRRLDQLEGSVPRKEIETAQSDLASLRLRKAAVEASLHEREPLTAPVSGLLSASFALAGQVVEARDKLFEIVDPKRLMVEALAYDASLATNIAGASATAREGTLDLAYLGGSAQLREQALPLQFRIRPPLPRLAVGQPVKVIARLRQRVKGVALPLDALAKNPGGEPVVWVHAEPERFVAKRVQWQALDAARILIVSGVAEGERAVTKGAAALTQAR